jgi:hypothetical protein
VIDELHASTALTLRKNRGSYWMGGRRQEGTEAGLDVVEKRKISFPFQETNRDPSAVQPVACSCTD